MAESSALLSRRQSEVLYRHLSTPVQHGVRATGFDSTRERWATDRSDDLDTLYTADQNPGTGFAWTLDIEHTDSHSVAPGVLVPMIGQECSADEVQELAWAFGWDYLDDVLRAVRSLPRRSSLGPVEFLVLVVRQSGAADASRAELELSRERVEATADIVEQKLDRARETVLLADRLEAGFE